LFSCSSPPDDLFDQKIKYFSLLKLMPMVQNLNQKIRQKQADLPLSPFFHEIENADLLFICFGL